MQTIRQAAAGLASGKNSAEQLAEACLARAADPNGEGGRVFIALDPQKIRAQAAASNRLRQHGIIPSLLAGVPVSVKDLFDVQGEVTAAGSRARADMPVALRDAPTITRLRAAGAVLFGRTNMTEFAYSGVGLNPHYGTPLNPYERSIGRIPGGSSSGAAVSVADGMAVVALGTDTGGSCRIPAALTGIVGYKPTAKQIPLDGVTPLSFSLDSIGSLGASVACVALVDQLLAGDASRQLSEVPLAGRRLGVPRTLVLDDMDAAVVAAFERSLSTLSKAGAHVSTFEMLLLKRLGAVNRLLVEAESSAWHKDLIVRRGNVYDPRVRTRIENGFSHTAADYLSALTLRRELVAEFDAITAEFDALVMPTTPIIAPPIAAFETDEDYRRLNMLLLRNPSVANVMDRCSISIPCHGVGEAPVGLMLIGGHGRDFELLSLAAAFEAGLEPSKPHLG